VALPPPAGRLTMVAPEGRGEGVRGGVAGAGGYLGEAKVAGAQVISGEGHSPLGEVLDRRLAESVLECSGEGRPREAAEGSEFGHCPWAGGVGVDGAEGWVQARICRGLIPARRLGALAERGTYGVDQDDVEEPVEDSLLAGCRRRQLAGEQADGIVQRVVIGVRQMEHGRERFYQLAAHVAGELVRAAEEHRRLRIAGLLIVRVLSSEVVCREAAGGRAVGDVVVEAAPDERYVTGGDPDRRLRVVQPQPGMTPDDGVDGELDGAGQPQPPRGSCD
jgi:hypothetical protein